MKLFSGYVFLTAVVLSRWDVLNVAPAELTVSQSTDLVWTLEVSQGFKAGDCIRIEVPNPYLSDDPDSYSSFEELGECETD